MREIIKAVLVALACPICIPLVVKGADDEADNN